MSKLLDAVNMNNRALLRQLLNNDNLLIEEQANDFPALRQAAELSDRDARFMQCATIIINAFDAYKKKLETARNDDSQGVDEEIGVPAALRERVMSRYKIITGATSMIRTQEDGAIAVYAEEEIQTPPTATLLSVYNRDVERQRREHQTIQAAVADDGPAPSSRESFFKRAARKFSCG